MSFLLIVPFVLILLAIALLPLLVPHWWESNSNKALVALTLGCQWLAISSCKARQGGIVSSTLCWSIWNSWCSWVHSTPSQVVLPCAVTCRPLQ